MQDLPTKQLPAKQQLKPDQQNSDQHKNLRPEGKPPPLLQTNTENRQKEKVKPLQPPAKPHPSTLEQPSVRLDHRGKKANNKEEKSAVHEGHTPPTTGNADPRTNPTPLPPPCSPTLMVSTSPRDGRTRN
ncbi:hypothetical protein TIFTF001_013546, partial [Ficus carica]